MTLKTIRIGSMVDIQQYDDAVFPTGIEVEGSIDIGEDIYVGGELEADGGMTVADAPVNPTDVLRLADVGTLTGDVKGPAVSTDHAIPRFDGVGGKTLLNSSVFIDDLGRVGIGTVNPTSPLQVVGLPIYANNAAAVAAGLTAGAFYRTGADPDPVCVVH